MEEGSSSKSESPRTRDPRKAAPKPKHRGLKALGPHADPSLIPGIPVTGEITEDTRQRAAATKLYISSYYESLMSSIHARVKRQAEVDAVANSQAMSEEDRKALREVYQEKETENLRLQRSRITVKHFETLRVIGRGSFGEVRVVRKKDTREIFALKKMRKEHMIKQKQAGNVRAERSAMQAAATEDDEWLVKLFYAFQDEEYLYLVMEFCRGGDLFNLLQSVSLSEDEIRFYLAEIVLAIESIHELGYLHRDMKPENILFDSNGHVKLADFGLCKPTGYAHTDLLAELIKDPAEMKRKARESGERMRRMNSKLKAETWRKKRRELAFSVVGTPGYAAPEVMMEEGYGQECDWWSLGVMFYEMKYGTHPFQADNVTDLCVNVLQWRDTLHFPSDVHCSAEARDLMEHLLCDREDRLTVTQIKTHPFFNEVVWDDIHDIDAPFVPELESLSDTSYFEQFEEEPSEDEGVPLGPRHKLPKKALPFIGFTFKGFSAVVGREDRREDET